MTYRRSPFRNEFDVRTKSLLEAACSVRAKSRNSQNVRDMTFQCAIFQTSASVEDYIKSTFENWVYEAKQRNLGMTAIPTLTRATMVADRVKSHIFSFAGTGDEVALLRNIESENQLWQQMVGITGIPPNIDGSVIFNRRKYPAPKNIKVLFARVGVHNIFDRVSGYLKTDAELRLTSFNSLRTAIAHSSPPQLTYSDIKRNLIGMQQFVGGLDRVIFSAANSHLGDPLW